MPVWAYCMSSPGTGRVACGAAGAKLMACAQVLGERKRDNSTLRVQPESCGHVQWERRVLTVSTTGWRTRVDPLLFD